MEKASAVRSRRWGVALLLLVVVACGKDAAPHRKNHLDLSKEYGDQVRARLAKLYAASETAQFAEANEPNVVVHEADTLVAESDDLTKQSKVRKTDPYDQTSAPGLLTLDESPVFVARSLVGSEEGYISDSSEPALKQLLAAKNVLIVYTQWDQYGAAAGTEAFLPFKVHGKAVLVEIDTGKPLGSFELTATNSNELTTHIYHGGNGVTNDAQRAVRADFVTQYRAAIANGIKTRWPGSTSAL